MKGNNYPSLARPTTVAKPTKRYICLHWRPNKEHFGAKEHNYSHWLSLNHTAGWWDLARFLFVNSFQVNGDHCLLLQWSYFNLPCVLLAHWLAKGLTEEEEALLQAIRPLVTNPDCHFLGSADCVGSVHLGRTNGLSYQGVFGLGKPAQLLPWLLAEWWWTQPWSSW